MTVPTVPPSMQLNGAAVLDEVHDTLTKYVVMPSPEATDAVTLWVAATHALPAFEHATRLAVHSPVKRCGKSRLREVTEALAYDPVSTTNISVPALFRIIDAAPHSRTLVLDEADQLFGSNRKDEENRDLIALLNNGFRDGSPTWRCVGAQLVPTAFSNYAMAMIVGIGRLPDTIEDRAVNITMRRKTPNEVVSKFRLRTDLPQVHAVRDRLAAWIPTVMVALEAPVADMPAQLEDRAQDTWEPLVAVADAAGGHWPARARKAALTITRQTVEDDGQQSEDLRLLADVKTVFDEEPKLPFMSTTGLLAELRQHDDAPWATQDFTARQLARRLGKFGVRPRHNSAKKQRGYHLCDLNDVLRRYLAPELPSDPSDPSEAPSHEEERPDGSEPPDGSTRPAETTCPDETAAQGTNGRVRTGWTGPAEMPEHPVEQPARGVRSGSANDREHQP